MGKQDINFLNELLYHTEDVDRIHQLSCIEDPLCLHYFAANYQWDSDFEVPNTILQNENCDLGTGLLLFHYADGFRLLENPKEISSSGAEEWKSFLYILYDKLLKADFNSQNISFTPELTKVQLFVLKKSNPNIPAIFISKSPGDHVEIPQI